MNSKDYNAKISQLLDDDATFKKLAKDPTKTTEKKVAAYVRKLGEKIDKATGFRLRNTDAAAPRIYGLPKIYKEIIPLRPIVSFVGFPT